MAAWQWGYGVIPDDIAAWILPVTGTTQWTVVSPVTGHSTVFGIGWWVIQAETGCLYAVPPAEFAKKYERFA